MASTETLAQINCFNPANMPPTQGCMHTRHSQYNVTFMHLLKQEQAEKLCPTDSNDWWTTTHDLLQTLETAKPRHPPLASPFHPHAPHTFLIFCQKSFFASGCHSLPASKLQSAAFQERPTLSTLSRSLIFLSYNCFTCTLSLPRLSHTHAHTLAVLSASRCV